MINSITVTNHLQESITIDMRSPEQSGFFIVSIDGLGPSKADINLTEMAGLDGSNYNSARAGPRNIVLELGFLENPTIETMRQKAYKYFPLKRQITFQINADNRIAKTIGYVESNEPNIFSSEETTVISIICPEAYLLDEFNVTTVFSSLTPVFEFPFSNESLVSKLIVLGTLTGSTIKSVIYEGDAQIGILIHIHAVGAASGVTITDAITLESIAIDSTKLATIVGSDIVAGDDIYISTVKGNKYATLTRSSTVYNILGALDDPDWFMLEKGDNLYAFTATSGLANLEFEIINDVAYEGI